MSIGGFDPATVLMVRAVSDERQGNPHFGTGTVGRGGWGGPGLRGCRRGTGWMRFAYPPYLSHVFVVFAPFLG